MCGMKVNGRSASSSCVGGGRPGTAEKTRAPCILCLLFSLCFFFDRTGTGTKESIMRHIHKRKNGADGRTGITAHHKDSILSPSERRAMNIDKSRDGTRSRLYVSKITDHT